MADAGNVFQDTHQRVVDADGVGCCALRGEETFHLYMASEAYHLISNGMLEANDHTNRDYHDRQSDSNTYGGNPNGRATHFAQVAIIGIYPVGKEKGKIHRSTIN